MLYFLILNRSFNVLEVAYVHRTRVKSNLKTTTTRRRNGMKLTQNVDVNSEVAESFVVVVEE
jgi:hypothetical protein